jgi:hypothetical protein
MDNFVPTFRKKTIRHIFKDKEIKEGCPEMSGKELPLYAT